MDSITFQGYWYYERAPDYYLPAEHVTVKLFDTVNSESSYGQSFTDINGFYSITISLEPQNPIFTRAYAENEAVKVENPLDPQLDSHFAASMAVDPPFSGTVSMPPGYAIVQETAAAFFGTGELWEVRDWFIANAQWAQPRETASLPEGITAYSHGLGCPGKILISMDSYWSDFSWSHEYGHAIMHDAYDCQFPTVPPGCGLEHFVYSECNPVFAWVEGWADFVGVMFSYTLSDSWSEQPYWNTHHEDVMDLYMFDGDSVEGSIMGVLTDLTDPMGEGIGRFDRVEDSEIHYDPMDPWTDAPVIPLGEDGLEWFISLWTVFRSNHPSDVRAFWSGWIGRYGSSVTEIANHHNLKVIYYDHGIRDTDGDGWSDNDQPYLLDMTITSQAAQNGLYKDVVSFEVFVGDFEDEDEPFLDVHWEIAPDLDTCGLPPDEFFEFTPPQGGSEGYFTASLNTASFQDCTFTIRAHADDGMERGYSYPVRITTDNTEPGAPVLSELHTGGAWSNHNSPWYQWTDPGDAYGILRFEWQLDSGPVQQILSLSLHLTVSDGLHAFKVRAIDTTENEGAWSNIVQVFIDTQAPTVLLTLPGDGMQSSHNSPFFEWQGADQPGLSGVRRYTWELHASTGCQAPSPSEVVTTESSYTPPPLADGTYSWRIEAEDWAGNFGMSSCRSFVNTQPAPVILYPESEVTHCSCRLDWSQSGEPDFVRYDVQRAEDNGGQPGTWATIATFTQSTQTTFTNTRLLGNHVYWYRIVLVDNIGVAVPSGTESVMTLPPVAPPATTVSFQDVASRSLTVVWIPHPSDCDFLKYTVHRSTTSGFTPGPGNQVHESFVRTSVQRWLDGLNPATTYYFIVRVWALTPNVFTDSSETAVTTTPDNGILDGFVYADQWGTIPVPGAVVHVYLNGQEIATDITESDGSYQITGLPTGVALVVTVTHPCGDWDDGGATIPPNGSYTLNFYANFFCE